MVLEQSEMGNWRDSELKIIMTEIKNSLEGQNNRFELEEERINESE